jgi:amino acid transporter
MITNIKNSFFKSISVVLISNFLIVGLFYLYTLLFLNDNSSPLLLQRSSTVFTIIADYLPLYSMILIGLSLLVHSIMNMIGKNSDNNSNKTLTLFEMLIIIVITISFLFLLFINIINFRANAKPWLEQVESSYNIIVPFFTLATLFLLSLLKLIFHFFKKDI